jgi:hypothetical protein
MVNASLLNDLGILDGRYLYVVTCAANDRLVTDGCTVLPRC